MVMTLKREREVNAMKAYYADRPIVVVSGGPRRVLHNTIFPMRDGNYVSVVSDIALLKLLGKELLALLHERSTKRMSYGV
jgi:hypothetical protein